MREHWRDPRMWRWWWQSRAPPEAKVSVAALAAAAVLGAGLYSAGRLSNAGVDDYGYVTTVQRVVTVRGPGTVARELVTVIRPSSPKAAYETKVGTRVVTAPSRVVRVPIVKRRVVTVNGKKQTSVVTSRQTVVDERTVTVVTSRNETVVQPVTQTVNRVETRTVVETRMVAVATVTQPLPVPVTVTVKFP